MTDAASLQADLSFGQGTGEAPEWIAAICPGLNDARNRLADAAMAPGGALPVRLKEIIAAAILALRHDPSVGLRMRRALSEGATLREIVEGIMIACVPGGQPCIHFAMPHIKVLIEELGDNANARRAPDGTERARTVRRSTHGRWDWMEDNYPEYQELRRAVNRLMHNPDDAALAPRYREMVNAVVLACRAYPTVPHHLRRAVEEGAGFEELVEAMQVGAVCGGLPVLQFAWPILLEIREDIAAGTLGPA